MENGQDSLTKYSDHKITLNGLLPFQKALFGCRTSFFSLHLNLLISHLAHVLEKSIVRIRFAVFLRLAQAPSIRHKQGR